MDFRTEQQLLIEIENERDRAEQYKRTVEVLAAERSQARARYDKAVLILSEIHQLLNPPRTVLPDGRTLEFRAPDAQERLQALSDLIRSIPDKKFLNCP